MIENLTMSFQIFFFHGGGGGGGYSRNFTWCNLGDQHFNQT